MLTPGQMMPCHSRITDMAENIEKNSPWRTNQHAKASCSVRQGAFLDSSRRVGQKMKSIFEKLFIFLKMLCQVFNQLFLPIARNIFSILILEFKDYGSISV
jgi:hypothetical protein